ncbi:ribonuclease H-like domain-containing protein [Tanacetum coccineum]
MRRVLLRCDSIGDLYPVTAPSPIPHAFLVIQHMWHQCLGHPGGKVLRRLVSSNFISYNKEKPPVLCHACQLSKHVSLPFVSSSTVISSCFDIIHSDAWTSPIPSLSSFKYYSPTAALPTPASPSSAQIHSPVHQPSSMAQHTPVQLQFSPTVVPHQTITASDQHAPVIIQNPSVNPNPNSIHPMVTRFYVGTIRPTEHLNLHVPLVSPLPKSYRDAFNDPNWQNAMRDEYIALIKNKTWTLVPRPPDTNIVRCMWLFLHKYLADGTLSHYKARLVANDSTQLEVVDVDETFSLKKYALEILDRAHMANCNPSRTPIDTESKLGSDGDLVSYPNLYRSLAGSLQYLTFTRPDISYVVQQIFSSSTTDLVSYSDTDWAGCPTTRRSTSGYCVFLGNNLLSWSFKRQPTLSRSSAESEYRGVANAVAEICWLRNLLRELHAPLSFATLVYCDNVIAASQVRVFHVPLRYQYADIFTKGLPSALFEEFRSSLSIRCPLAPTAGEC